MMCFDFFFAFFRNWPSNKNIEVKEEQKKTNQSDGIALETKEFT